MDFWWRTSRKDSFFMVELNKKKAADIKIRFLWCLNLWKMTILCWKSCQTSQQKNSFVFTKLKSFFINLISIDFLMPTCEKDSSSKVDNLWFFESFLSTAKKSAQREEIFWFISTKIFLCSYWEITYVVWG